MLFFKVLNSNDLFTGKSFEMRDYLCHVNLPPESWIDLRVLEKWAILEIPIPLISIFIYLEDIQEDGSIKINGIPNTGATYRFIELAGLLGLSECKSVKMAKEYLESKLLNGGLQAPGPIDGALVEVGTTARALHIFKNCFPESLSIKQMGHFLKSRAYIHTQKEYLCWHTDKLPEEIEYNEECIVGATSLALYALIKIGYLDEKETEWGCNWILDCQNKDGGWPDKKGNPSNIDNTFNSIRALKSALEGGILNNEIKERVRNSLKRAFEYISSLRDKNLGVSALAMKLRSLLYLYDDPLNRKTIEVLNRLIEKKDFWYRPDRHIYNEILLCAITIAEWRKSMLQKHGTLKLLQKEGTSIEDFLMRFPVEIPPFYKGFKNTLGEKIANWLTRQRCKPSVVNAVSESITLQDIVALILSFIIMTGVFINTDFIKSITFKLQGPLNNWVNILVGGFYLLWLAVKFKIRINLLHFFITTLLTLGLSYFVVFHWLRLSNEIVKALTPLLLFRLMLVYAMVLDIGKRAIDVSRLNAFFLPRHRQ